MNELRCLIVDDEELARVLLDNYISRLPFLKLVGQCKNPIEALQILQTESIDLIFLDIQMPEMIGTDFLKTLSNPPMVILTTAYSEYALEGYELNVVDYLLKPFPFDRFLKAVNKANELAQSKQPSAILVSPTPSNIGTATEQPKNFILVKSEHKLHRIFFKDILYIQSMREYVAYHTVDGRIMSLGSLKQLSEDLPKDLFLRVHKSYIINQSKVATLEGNLLHIAKEQIPIGASYRAEVLEVLF